MTDAVTPAPSLPDLPSGRFSGREAFMQLVRDGLATAARDGWSEIIVSDSNFHDWPLGELAVIESLQQWAHSGHPRFVRWRGTWDHIISCRRSPSADPLDLPSAFWSPAWVMHRLDPVRCVGVAGFEPERRVLLRESLNEWLRSKSSPGFPSTTLGL